MFAFEGLGSTLLLAPELTTPGNEVIATRYAATSGRNSFRDVGEASGMDEIVSYS